MKTSERPTSLSGKTVSTCLPVDSRASRSASQESGEVQKTTATCGPRCSTLFGLFDRAGSLARTFTESLIGRKGWSSNRCALTWKRQDTRCSRTLFRLAVSVLPTVGTDAGLLPTVQTQGLKRCVNGKTVFMPLSLLPTPTAIDAGSGRMNKSLSPNASERPTLAMASKMGLLPTPTANDAKNVTLPASPGHTQRTTQNSDAKRRIPDWNGFPTQPPVCGGDDGFPGELAGIAFPRWSREAVKACGNAIVPQVALQIFETINEYESK